MFPPATAAYGTARLRQFLDNRRPGLASRAVRGMMKIGKGVSRVKKTLVVVGIAALFAVIAVVQQLATARMMAAAVVHWLWNWMTLPDLLMMG